LKEFILNHKICEKGLGFKKEELLQESLLNDGSFGAHDTM